MDRCSNSRPSAPNKRLIMLIMAGVIGAITFMAVSQIWYPIIISVLVYPFISSALVGLVIYEILYRRGNG